MLKKQLSLFLIIGSLTVLIDFLVYQGFVWLQLLSVDVSKAVGFLTGTAFAYFANRHWTFGQHTHAQGSAIRFAILYACTLSANVWFNSFILASFSQLFYVIPFAFLMATGLSMSLNFIGMKWFVFKKPKDSEFK